MISELIPHGFATAVQELSPLITAYVLMILGYSVEKHYTSRPALFANGGALITYYFTYLLPNQDPFRAMGASATIGGMTVDPVWALIELYVFAGIFAGHWGMDSYSSSRRNSSGFHNVVHIFYSSFAVGVVIALSFLVTA